MNMTPRQKQGILAITMDAQGEFYYNGKLDGQWGSKSQEAAERFLKDFTGEENWHPEEEKIVMAFSLARDGELYLTENFQVKEFACQDGSDPVFIHPQIPIWCQMAREINGPFTPNSAYRTVSHNAKPDVGGAANSYHLYGLAVDIPAEKASPQELYDFFEELLGNTCELGIYSWGIHVAVCSTCKRFVGST